MMIVYIPCTTSLAAVWFYLVQLNIYDDTKLLIKTIIVRMLCLDADLRKELPHWQNVRRPSGVVFRHGWQHQGKA
jgi:hypothetical protein